MLYLGVDFMYQIGEFSILSKTTIKTLRYYEKEGLLCPSFVDEENGYRYYETSQLLDLSHIISLRQLGISIKDIKSIFQTGNIEMFLRKRKEEIEKDLLTYQHQLSKINYILEERNMNYEIMMKELPSYTVYYKEGIIKNYSEITSFILSSAEECKKTNPNLKCIQPDYCFVSYLDGEYKETNVKIKYSQAVEKAGISNETIRFEQLKPVNAVCIYHKGTYDKLPDAYHFMMDYIEKNNLQIVEPPRERYIDGMWNKENQEDWLTEIQVPVIKK